MPQANRRLLYEALAELTRRHAAPPLTYATGALTAFELQGFSQNGEDGVIAEIMRRIEPRTRFFVEFGVESGREGNCVYLADVLRWSGLFMEADPAELEDPGADAAPGWALTAIVF